MRMSNTLSRNASYWKNRTEEISNIQYSKADKLCIKLTKEYQRAERYMQEQINLYYARYARDYGVTLADAKKLLTPDELNDFKMTLEEFMEKAKNNEDGRWSQELDEEYLKSRISRLEALQNSIDNRFIELKNTQMNITENHLRDVFKDTYSRSVITYGESIGIGKNFAQINDAAVTRAIFQKWTNEKNFAGRIDDDKRQLLSSLNKTITQGLIVGSSSDSMVKKLMKETKVSRNRAINLIQTETTFIIGQANTQMYKDFGLEECEILETLDDVTCETCRAMDGKIIKVSEKKEGVNAPPFHTRCRGTTIPVSKYAEIWGESKRAARDENGNTYYTNAKTYKEWENEKNSHLEIPSKINKIANSGGINFNKKAEDFINKDLTNKDVKIDKNYSKPFTYNMNDEKLYINPSHPDFNQYDFVKSIVHETLHKLDVENGISINLAREINDCIKATEPLLKTVKLSKNLEDNLSICDIIGCVTKQSNVGNYGHSQKYYSQLGNVERELVANLTTEYICEDVDGISFINQYKPLKDLLEKIIKEYRL